ncbi:MAG: hypothetical protein ACLFU8_08020 [Anaerolineales bacterium]
MRGLRRGRWVQVGLVVLLLVASLACAAGGLRRESAPTDEIEITEPVTTAVESSPTESPPTETPEPTPTTEPTATPEPPATETVEPEPDETLELTLPGLESAESGMTGLETFRQRLQVRFTPQETGETGTYGYEAEVDLTARALHATLWAEGEVTESLPASRMEIVWIGERMWVKLGRLPWMEVTESVEALALEQQTFAVGDFLPFAPNFERVGEADVNGIPTVHYTYSATNLETEYGQVSGAGDVYVAQEGGYVARYTLEGSGDFEIYYEGEGTVSVLYETYDVGAAVEITPPQ